MFAPPGGICTLISVLHESCVHNLEKSSFYFFFFFKHHIKQDDLYFLFCEVFKAAQFSLDRAILCGVGEMRTTACLQWGFLRASPI